MEERLAQSLHKAVRLVLGMEQQDYRVQRPWSATVVQPEQLGEALDPDTRIIEVFDRPKIARQLLILGEPGAGKTTMLLELAQELLERAKFDRTEPIPVILSLSAWKDPKQPIFEWLAAELKAKYGLRQDLAKQLFEKHQLLPLLDGLDEVAPQHQKACARAINDWLTEELTERPCGVLICCRREEFEQVVQEPLSLYGAIYVQALNPQQIEEYFAQFDLQHVWQTVHQDAALQELLTKPLFLSMFGLVATQGKFVAQDWSARSTSEEKVEYLLDTYWEATIERELILDPVQRKQGILSKTYGKKSLPTRQAVRRSLVFAAKALTQKSGTEFLIEKLQPDFLQTQRQKWAYCLIFGYFGSLALGLNMGLTFYLLVNSIAGLAIGLTLALTYGPIFMLSVGFDEIEIVEKISISMFREARKKILQSLIKSLLVGLVFGLFFGLISNQNYDSIFDRIDDPIFDLIFGPVDAPMFGPIDGLIFGPIFGLVFVMVLDLIFQMREEIEDQIEPNQGIKNSFKNMVIISAIILIMAFFLKSLLERFLANIIAPTLLPRLVAFSLTLLIWSSFLGGGGLALVQHISLRIVLAWNRYAPFRYDLLLDYCTERLLLQRIGGRYRFMHRLLQDHFAQMDL